MSRGPADRGNFAIALTVASVLAAGACGGGQTLTGEPTFDLPTAMSAGGSVLSSPRVQPIFLAGFPYGAEIDRFMAALSTSRYWTTVGGEYGVGALSVLPSFVSPATVPGTAGTAQMQSLLTESLQAMTAANPSLPVRGDTIYALFFGPETALTIMGTTLCGSGHPSGFHDEWLFGQTRLAVVVMPTCASSDADARLTGFDVITPSLSHELLEAATDPYPRSAPAFAAVDDDHALWAEAVHGGELADLCENEVPSLVTPSDVGFPVQRTWSNAGARAGTGPCVPVPAGEIYFNGQADLPDEARLDLGGGAAINVPALSAAVGQNVSAHVTLRGMHNASSSVGVLAFEVNGDDGVLMAHSKPITAKLGQKVLVPVDPLASAKAGLTPLLVIAGTNGALHLWVGGINRR